MKKLILIAILLSGGWRLSGHPLTGVEPDSLFLNPPLRYRMGLNTHSTPADVGEQEKLIDGYLDCGYGGLATNVNWTDDYLRNTDEINSMFRFVRMARDKGMDVWLYDENWYPSGMCYTYILDEHPEWECEGLFFRRSDLSSGEHLTDSLPFGRPVLLRAYPRNGGIVDFDKPIDLSLYSDCGRVNWSAPEGSDWSVAMVSASPLRKGFQTETDRGGRALSYPSLLMPEVGKRFVELTHKRYADVLGAPLSTLFSATFTDEPSSMALPYYPLGWGVYPWKQNVTKEFEKRSGTHLYDALPRIMMDEGPTGDYYRTVYFGIVSDFISNNFFGTVKDFCNGQGIGSGGHLLLEESLMAHPLLYGDIMACFRLLDIPGIDVLTVMPEFTNRYLLSSRLASSAAELEGGSTVMSEICPVTDPIYRNGSEASTVEAVGTINRQMIGGVTKFNNYLQLQHEDNAGKRRVNEYVGRITEAMDGGTRVSEIAVVYPVATMWSKMLPLETGLYSWDRVSGGTPQAQHLDSLFEDVSMRLYAANREFSYLDDRALRESEVCSGLLRNGALDWRAVLLPAVETISEEAMLRLVEFAESGGRVIAVETVPRNSLTEFPSAAIGSLSARLAESSGFTLLPSTAGSELETLLDKLVKPAITISGGDGILTAHRRVAGEDVFFVVNDTDRTQNVAISIPEAASLRHYSPTDGTVAEFRRNKLKLTIAPYRGEIIKAAMK